VRQANRTGRLARQIRQAGKNRIKQEVELKIRQTGKGGKLCG
jgi:hypothetical protein